MEIGSLLTPLWWLWYGLALLFSHSWALAVFIAVLSTLFLVIRHWQGHNPLTVSRSKGARVITKPATLVQEVLQVLPVHPHNGWNLDRVSHGLRVFARFFPSLGVPATPCLATSVLIDTSPKKLLGYATSGKDLPSWVPKVTTPPQYIQQPQGAHNHDADIIILTFQSTEWQKSRMEWLSYHWRQLVTRFTQKYARFLDGIVGLPTNFHTEVFDREWKINGEGCGSVCWVARQPSRLPYLWSILFFTAAPREKSMSIATLVMLPNSPSSQSSTSSLLTSQMVALQHFLSLRRARAYSSLSSSSPTLPRRVTSDPTLPSHMTSAPPSLPQAVPGSVLPPAVPPLERKTKKGRQRDREAPIVQYPVEKPAKQVSEQVEQGPQPLTPNGLVSTSAQSSLSTAQSPLLGVTPTSPLSPSPHSPPSPHTSPYAHLDEQYEELGRESCTKLVQASMATEQDGWTTVGNTKGILIMKKSPKKGEGSVNCIKGTGLIQAPPEFVFRLIRNPENNNILDDLLKETRVICRVTEASALVHLLYKSVWPTAPRDFTVISTAGRYDEHTLVEAGVSVVDPRTPEEKGYVRGNLVCGGYVVKVCPGQPEQCEVTYVSQAELKGSIPTFAVNKVTESQPQCVSRLRTFAENSYAEMKGDPQKMKALEESVFLGPIFPPPPLPPASSTPPSLTTALPAESVDGGGGGGGGGVLGGGERAGGSVNNEEEGGGVERGSREGGEVGRGEGVRRGREEGDRSPPSVLPVGTEAVDAPSYMTPQLNGKAGVTDEEGPAAMLQSWAILSSPPPETVAVETVGSGRMERLSAGGGVSAEDGLLVMESLETYTPEQITTDEEEEEEEGEVEEERGVGVGQEKEGRETTPDASGGGVMVTRGERGPVEGTEMERERRREEEEVKRVCYEKNLPPYQTGSTPVLDSLVTTTDESISYPRQQSGGVDYRTLGNQTAARVLEELFHVSNLNLSNPSTFQDQESGWKFVGMEKDVAILKKKTPGNPFHSVMGKGLIYLPPQEVYDSICNPQLGFTYDNMLKELHIVKQIEEGLYILHVHHETTQCFIRQSRDFCILINERREGDKLLLVGTSVETPECPANPNITRGKITYSGWVVESRKIKGKVCAEVTYLIQVDLGGIPATLVNHISKRQPLAIAYLRDYLISTSLMISSRESSPN